MAAYVLIDVEITDETAFAEFREQPPTLLEAHGGKILVRGGAADVVQGDWTPHRLVLLAFDSVERARAWWHSPEHTEIRAQLDRCSKATATIVEGV